MKAARSAQHPQKLEKEGKREDAKKKFVKGVKPVKLGKENGSKHGKLEKRKDVWQSDSVKNIVNVNEDVVEHLLEVNLMTKIVAFFAKECLKKLRNG